MKSIRHIRTSKIMSFNQKIKIKWREMFRVRIGVYEPLINISNLFKEVD